ncbi:hypothetical protein GGR22_000106 [Flavobacterium gossypii]|jgi:hypothetical protein|uniref:Uncharacterized protein n=2 Tax=Flavobacterium TaxID=237 RepID=A0A495MHV8_9FLAO|nr:MULTISPECIES: hypothetical protein [Flavobacterium]MBA9071980.1 hypothetical protein [Flavobacterium gossypii]RKS25018.1 hypothetical protein CLV94_0040 [Flavobacterium endophyticum]WDO12478.1 hypothetical protein MH928_14235 [Flavobacterium sp. WW92]
MSQQIFIGNPLSFKSIRDYIFDHKINKGDSIVLNPLNFKSLIEEIKHSAGETFEIPINVFGVLLLQDDSVELGKIQIVKNENLNS